MSRSKIAVATVATVALLLSLLAAGGSAPASASAATSVSGIGALGVSTVAAGRKKNQPNPNWDIKAGAKFNDPRFGKRKKFRINRKIMRTIKNTPKGEKIWIMSWNLAWRGVVDQLIKAHKRGVSVRFIMSRGLFKDQGHNAPGPVLKRALKKGNKKRTRSMRSWLKTCSGSCRGKPGTGSMHSKFMMVTKAGKREKIVQQGSSNFTVAAGTLQWNDWYTTYENNKIWKAYKKVFKQSKKDRKFKQVNVKQGEHHAWFDPNLRKDPVMRVLNKVTCKGARGGTGVNGKTSLRVAAAVLENQRGYDIARKLKRLHNQGCDITIMFTMMPDRIRNVLSGIPLRHLAYDWDGDGSYDRYMHMKAMTVSGHWKSDRSHKLVIQGSPNWDRLSRRSDEQGMVIHDAKVVDKYNKKINEWFAFAPGPGEGSLRARGGHDVEVYEDNPAAYDELELELAGQG